MKSFTRFGLLGVLAIQAPVAFAAGDSKASGPFVWAMDPTTNTAFVAMLLFLAIAWRMGAFKAITGGLDQRAATIAEKLEEAKSLRESASKMLAEAERKQREADAEAKSIIEQAKADSEAMMKEARLALAQKVERREALAEERIRRAEAEAAAEVRRVAADTATSAARQVLLSDTSIDQFELAATEIEKALNN